MPRGRKKATVSEKKLLDALKFISVAQTGKSDAAIYCMLHENMAVAFDGITAAGCPIVEELECCPHTDLFIAALESSAAEYQIVQMPDNRLELTSDEYRVSIPCSTGQGLTWRSPALPMGTADNLLRDALKIVGNLVSDKADLLIAACAVIGSGSAIATNNRTLALEAWHGAMVPRDFLVPKAFIKAIGRTKKNIIGYSYDETTFTIWFEDQSWIQTQIYTDAIPDSRSHLGTECAEWIAAPLNLIPAVQAVLPFGNGNIITNGRLVSSDSMTTTEARQALLDTEMPPRIYDGEALLLAAKYMHHFNADLKKFTMFRAGNVRGCVKHEIYENPQIALDRAAAARADCKSCRDDGCCNGTPCCGECIPF